MREREREEERGALARCIFELDGLLWVFGGGGGGGGGEIAGLA